jgi:hypothetical protein
MQGAFKRYCTVVADLCRKRRDKKGTECYNPDQRLHVLYLYVCTNVATIFTQMLINTEEKERQALMSYFLQ